MIFVSEFTFITAALCSVYRIKLNIINLSFLTYLMIYFHFPIHIVGNIILFVYFQSFKTNISHQLFDYKITFVIPYTQNEFLTLSNYWLHSPNQIWVKNIYHLKPVFVDTKYPLWNSYKHTNSIFYLYLKSRFKLGRNYFFYSKINQNQLDMENRINALAHHTAQIFNLKN